MKRKIPSTMATQHPDHAATPFWHKEAFISTQYESEESYLAYSELGIKEYKWDWEGKLVDESILERLFSEYFDFFKNKPLGVDTFLTFRLPNPKVETEFRIGRALMNLASAASEARHFKLPSPPIFELILPMTETSEEMLSIQEAYQDMHKLTHPLYRLEGILSSPRIIPLFEDVPTIIKSDEILEKYLTLHKKRFKKNPPYMRPYLARSDPALNFGLVPTVLAIKIALSKFKHLEKKLNIPFYPIIGAATLPFRGGLNPERIEQFAKEYAGIRTTTIQSAFRYDFPLKTVKKAIKQLDKMLTKEPVIVPEKDIKQIEKLIPFFEKFYKEVIENVSEIINQVAVYLPKRRERVQHTGLYGYSRGVGQVKLPRAIGFTAAFYSLGVPPEFIGTGRGLKQAQSLGKLDPDKIGVDLIKKYYLYIKEDLEEAGRFLNKENLEKLAKSSKAWSLVLEDVISIEEVFNIKLGSNIKEDKKHNELTAQILQATQNGQDPANLIVEAALLRKSLG